MRGFSVSGLRRSGRLTGVPVLLRDDVSLAYDDTGERDRPPIVFIHGLSGARTTWMRITPAVRDAYRVITLDQRGHGDSSHAPGTYTLEHYGPDAAAFLQAVVGEPAALVGHSLGGVVAAWAARHHPDRVTRIFLEDPPLFRTGDEARDDRSRGVAEFFPVMRELIGDMQSRHAPIDEYVTIAQAVPVLKNAPELAQAQAEAWSTLDPATLDPAIAGNALEGADPEVPIPCPTHVLRADPRLGAAFHDDDASRFARTNPDATITLVEGASHLIHDERPDVFIEELLKFLAN